MSVLWLDGGDTYASDAAVPPGNYEDQNNINTTSGAPRTGINALKLQSNFDQGFLGKFLPSAKNLVFAGWAIRTVYTGSTSEAYMRIQSGFDGNSSNPVNNYIVFYTLPAGAFAIDKNVGGTVTRLFTSATGIIPSNAYCYIELSCDRSTGVADIWFNGNVHIANISGITGLNAFTAVYWGGARFDSQQFRFDDIYITDDKFLGAQRCYTLFPNADETPQNWTLSGGATAWSLINAPNFNTANYIQGSNIGDKSKFGCTNLPMSSALINGCRLVNVSANVDAGSALIRQRAYIGAGTYDGSDKSPSTSPISYNDVITLLGVSVADINAMSLEMEKTG